MTATMLTATIAHSAEVASGTNDKGSWTRSSVILAPANSDLSQEVPVITAETFLDKIPPVGSTVRVVIENRKRVVGTQVYENRNVVQFIEA